MKSLNNLTAFLMSTSICVTFGQISLQHPNDVGIGGNPSVVFAEMFEQDSIPEMISSVGYQHSQMLSHINFDPSVPPGSLGSQSLKLTTVENSAASNDTMEDANILKKFSNGITDSVFVRYYVKFNTNFNFHHSGVWMGGTNPANACWPCNKPGRTIPTSGDSAFVIGTEIRGNATHFPSNNSIFGFYNYWMDMKPLTSAPNAGKYYGNDFISTNPNSNIDMSAWNCIEVMIKLNNPADSSGELKLWINGELMGYYGQGFPNGSWSQATFIEGPGSPFYGFRFRSTPNVVFNYIWLKNYATDNTSSAPNDVLFDHVIVAKDYIGPIYNPFNNITKNSKTKLSISPNPTNSELNFSEFLNNYIITNSLGQKITTGSGKFVSTTEFKNGIYFLKTDDTFLKFIVEH